MRFYSVIYLAFLILFNACNISSAGISSKTSKTPDKTSVIAIADKYIGEIDPKLSADERTAIDKIKFTLNSQKQTPAFFAESVSELVNDCTIALAKLNGLGSIIETSCYLVKYDPANPRTSNLLGVALRSIKRNQDASVVFEYALTLQPKSELIMLNIANTYLDLNEDKLALAMINKVIAKDPYNKSAYAALACYWYKKGDTNKMVAAMQKAATFGGFKIRQKIKEKTDEDEKVISQSTASEDDSVETIEQILDRANKMTPRTTADLLDDSYPDVANKIRDEYGKLKTNDRLAMPAIPTVNISSLKDWVESGEPYINQWRKSYSSKVSTDMRRLGKTITGINPKDSKQAQKTEKNAYAKKEMIKQFAQAMQTIEMLESNPAIPQSKIREAKQKLKAEMAKHGIKLSDLKKGGSDDDANDSQDENTSPSNQQVPGDWDKGSIFATTNYRDYQVIRKNYSYFFKKACQDYMDKVSDIEKVYGQKMAEEQTQHEANLERIKNSQSAEDFAYQKEVLRHKKAVNAIGDNYYKQWVQLAFHEYDHRFKPRLEEYWNVCGLYVRNMNDREIMKREFVSIKQEYYMYGGMIVSSLDLKNVFTYLGTTDEEEQQLENDIREAQEEAAQRDAEYQAMTKTADDAFDKWVADNLTIGVAAEFLSMSISPRKFVVEEYIAGMNFKHEFDFMKGEWTTYRSFAAKVDIGFQIGGLKAGVKADYKVLESYDTFNCRNGQVVDSGSSFAKASAETGISVSGMKVTGGKIKVTIDPAADNEFSAKIDPPGIGYKKDYSK